MSGGLTNYAADQVLIGVAIPTSLYLKLHLNNPGPNALLFPALETTRKLSTFVPADLPAKSWNSNTLSWPGIAANETVPWFSLWSAATGGNPWFIGVFNPVFSLVVSTTGTLDPYRVILNSTPFT